MRVRKLDIFCVSEKKKKGCEMRETEKGHELCSGVDNKSHSNQ